MTQHAIITAYLASLRKMYPDQGWIVANRLAGKRVWIGNTEYLIGANARRRCAELLGKGVLETSKAPNGEAVYRYKTVSYPPLTEEQKMEQLSREYL